MTEPSVMKVLQELEGRTYTTYRARVEAHRRINTRAAAWNAALIGASLASAVGGVALLVYPDLYDGNGALIFAALSIATLVVSLVITNQKYEARSASIFNNYRSIQRLSADIELYRITVGDQNASIDDVEEFHQRYQTILDQGENHTTYDYMKSRNELNIKNRIIPDFITYVPFAILVVPAYVFWSIISGVS